MIKGPIFRSIRPGTYREGKMISFHCFLPVLAIFGNLALYLDYRRKPVGEWQPVSSSWSWLTITTRKNLDGCF